MKRKRITKPRRVAFVRGVSKPSTYCMYGHRTNGPAVIERSAPPSYVSRG